LNKDLSRRATTVYFQLEVVDGATDDREVFRERPPAAQLSVLCTVPVVNDELKDKLRVLKVDVVQACRTEEHRV